MAACSTLQTEVHPPHPGLARLLSRFDTPRACARLPRIMMEGRIRNPDFSCRHDVLQTLDRVLLPMSKTPPGHRLMALYGKPGEGKTEIANEFVFSRRNKFDVVFWINAESDAKLKQDLAGIASYLDLERCNGDRIDPADSREFAKAWLKEPYVNTPASDISPVRADWLLVLDNCNNVSLLTQLRDVFPYGAVLVTSTDPISSMALGRYQTSLKLEPFSESDSITVLRRITNLEIPPTDARHAREFVAMFGGWALALRQMACLIRHECLTLADCKKKYMDLDQRRDLHQRQTASTNYYPFTMASALIKDSLSSGAFALLQVLSMLNPSCIQEELFAPTMNMSSATVSEFPVLKRGRYFRNRADLIQLSLISATAEYDSWIISNVVQETVRSQMSRDRFRGSFTMAVALVARAWGHEVPTQRHSIKYWSHYSKWFPHVLRLQRLHRDYAPAGFIDPSLELARLLTEAGWWLLETSMFHTSRTMLLAAHQLAESFPETDITRELLSDIYYGLGGWANETNHPAECLRYNKTLVNMRLRIVGLAKQPLSKKAAIKTAMAFNQRGTGYMMTKDYKSAIEEFRSSRACFEALKSDFKCADSVPTVNLACAYWLSNDLDRATGLLEDGLAARVEAFGENDTESFRTGRFLHTLGNVCFDRANLAAEPERRAQLMDESYEYHQRALSQYQQTISVHHHRTADVCHRVADHCIRRADYESARKLIDQALKIWSADQPSFLNEIARTTYLDARLVELQTGDLQRADDLRAKAARIRSTILNLGDQVRIPANLLEQRDFDELVAFWSR